VKPVSRAVDRLLRGLGIATDVARVDAIHHWPAVATAVFGPDGSDTRAVGLDGTTLVVAVPTSAWASEIRLREAQIVERLAAAAPRSGIRAIRTIPSMR
jgi:predicted nucleic acid-binding Zn ribbon protein